ncbi:hypothetical protein DOU54_05675 [Agrobacterium sp. MS2]|nr:hypothetical protein DOU54_05675 [Agrobacterium sp. MS2]
MVPQVGGVYPLCPAGHLPLKGGDRNAATSRTSQPLRMRRQRRLLLISPLEGEMPGRAEGVKPHPPLATHNAPRGSAKITAM